MFGILAPISIDRCPECRLLSGGNNLHPRDPPHDRAKSNFAVAV
jgi:hypothetical protein